MSEDNGEQVLQELTLILLYLTRFKESKDTNWKAWKGYDFQILDKLKSQNYISYSYKSKSVYINEKLEKEIKTLLEKHNINHTSNPV